MGKIKVSLCLSSLISLIFFPFMGYANPSPGETRLAVLQLTQQISLSKQEIGYLTDVVRKITAEEVPKNFLVLTQESIMTLIPPDRNIEDCEGTCAVETGRLLDVKYIITGNLLKFAGKLRLTLRLHDTETGKMLGSEIAKSSSLDDMETQLQKSAKRLLSHFSSSSAPSSTPARFLSVSLYSIPEGASISIDGVQRCSAGSKNCKVQLKEGRHKISMSLANHLTRTETVVISPTKTQVNWGLQTNSGRLEVTSKPKKLKVLINQKEYITPASLKVEPSQNYEVTLNDPCFEGETQSVIGQVEQPTQVHFQAQPKEVMVKINAVDGDGKDLKVSMLIDSANVGTTPAEISLPVCSKELILNDPVYGIKSVKLNLKDSKEREIKVVLNDSSSSGWVKWSLIGLGVGLIAVGTYLLVDGEDSYHYIDLGYSEYKKSTIPRSLSSMRPPPSEQSYSSGLSRSSLSNYSSLGMSSFLIGSLLIPITYLYFDSDSDSTVRSKKTRIGITPLHQGGSLNLMGTW